MPWHGQIHVGRVSRTWKGIRTNEFDVEMRTSEARRINPRILGRAFRAWAWSLRAIGRWQTSKHRIFMVAIGFCSKEASEYNIYNIHIIYIYIERDATPLQIYNFACCMPVWVNTIDYRYPSCRVQAQGWYDIFRWEGEMMLADVRCHFSIF